MPEKDNLFAIYQVKDGDEYSDQRFQTLDRLARIGLEPAASAYELAYTGILREAYPEPRWLGQLNDEFNTAPPADFLGHTLSTSDVVVIRKDDTETAYYLNKGAEFVPLADFAKDLAVPPTVPQFDPAVQPVVTILLSEEGELPKDTRLPLSYAESKFYFWDEARKPEPWYNKVQFRMDYSIAGEPHSYEGRYDLGDGDGGLIEHIRTHADYYRHDEFWQKRFAEQGPEKLAETNDGYDYVLETLVPYMKSHCRLAEVQEHAVSSLEKILMGEPTAAGLKMAGYYRACLQYVEDCRKRLNTSEEVFDLPEPPEQDAYMQDPATRAYEGRTVAELRQEARDAAMTLDEYAANDYEPKEIVQTLTAVKSNYKGMVALVGVDDNVYLGLQANYDKAGLYYNMDGSLLHISNDAAMVYFLHIDNYINSQAEMLDVGVFTTRQYREFALLRDGLLRQFEAEREICFAGKPFEPPENYLRAAELSTEQNYNMIDGQINNLPPEPEPGPSSLAERLKEAKQAAAEQPHKEQPEGRDRAHEPERC